MNEYLHQIFAAAGGQDIDPDVAAAGALLSKVAEEQGVNLDDFSDDEIGGMLSDIMGGESDEGGESGEGAVSAEPPAAKTASDLTVADVSAELAKTAAAEGVDLTELSREDYHQAFNWQLEQMQNPSYFETKVAMQEKVAEADMLGRVMAHSFNDELTKVAFNPNPYAHKAEMKRMGLDNVSKAKKVVSDAGGRVKELASGAGGKAKELSGKAVEFARNHPKSAIAAGVGTGLLAAGGAGLALKKGREKSKAAFDSEAAAMAVLEAHGWSFE